MDRDGIERLGRWIREARTERDMTQAHLAAAAGMSTSRLQEIEAGKGVRGPHAGTKTALELALEVPFGTLTRVAAGQDPDTSDNGEADCLGEEDVRQLAQALADLADRVARIEHPQVE